MRDSLLHGSCVVCSEPAPYIVLGSFRCVSHRETTVVGKAEPGPPTVQVSVASRPADEPSQCYYECVDGHHTCGKPRGAR